MDLAGEAKTKYRLTAKRQRILKIIETDAPLTADQIYLRVRQTGQVNLSTVYRNLKILLEMGLIRKVFAVDGHAEQYETPKDTCEHSVICTKCGATVSFSGCFFGQIINTVENQTDFQIKQHRLEIYGLCPRCKKKK
jgi:Fur family ferric uptake transcriptional regulator